MIGKISMGKSFRGCLNYCLHDKLKTDPDEPAMKNRAEVVLYNRCFGNASELIKQFNELRAHNQKLSKPVLHVTLSLAPGEIKSNNILSEIAMDCATQLGFESNMFIAVMRKDTRSHQHLHLVVNRIGFDGKTLSDSNSYKRMADCCRKLEQKHQLQQVLSPRKFLSQELRNIPRHDSRKEKLKQDIIASLQVSRTYAEFEHKMKGLSYRVIHGRGIAFVDRQKVYLKGSEVGFSLMRIEKQLAQQQNKEKVLPSLNQQVNLSITSKPAVLQKEVVQSSENQILESLTTPIQQNETIDPLLMKRKKQRKRGLRI